MNRFSILGLIAAAMILTQSVAPAATPGEVPSVRIQFADLDLTQPAGAKVLYQRLSAAARTVCSPLQGRALASEARFRACMQQSTSAAVAQIDRPALTIYALAHSGAHNPSPPIARN